MHAAMAGEGLLTGMSTHCWTRHTQPKASAHVVDLPPRRAMPYLSRIASPLGQIEARLGCADEKSAPFAVVSDAETASVSIVMLSAMASAVGAAYLCIGVTSLHWLARPA